MIKFLILPAVTLALVGCGGNSSTSSSATTSDKTGTGTGAVSITEADAGQTVKIDVGNTLEVTLKSNVTTGYHWEAITVDSAILQQADPSVYVSDPNPDQLVGSGGKTTFVFKALTAGESGLKLNYMSPGNEQSETSFSVTVRVGQ